MQDAQVGLDHGLPVVIETANVPVGINFFAVSQELSVDRLIMQQRP